MVKLLCFTFAHDEDPIHIYDRCESVGDNQHCAVAEKLTQLRLNEVVSLEVNISSGLVQNEDLCATDDSPRHAHELLFSGREQRIALGAIGTHSVFECADLFGKTDVNYDFVNFLLTQLIERVKVLADGSLEQEWRLRDISNIFADSM